MHSFHGIGSSVASAYASVFLLGVAASCSSTETPPSHDGSATGGRGQNAADGSTGGTAAAPSMGTGGAGTGAHGAGASGGATSGGSGGATSGGSGGTSVMNDGGPVSASGGGQGGGGSPGAPGGTVLPFGGTATITTAVDANGTIHVATSAYRSGNGYWLVYGECAAHCGDIASWTTVDLAKADQSNPPSIALTASGAPRILFAGDPTGSAAGYYYAQCDSGCTDATSWYAVQLTTSPSPQIVSPARLPFAVSPGGRVAFLNNNNNADQLYYCKTNCGDGTSWTEISLGDGYTPERVAFGGDDDLQLLQRYPAQQGDEESWVQCQGDCTSPGSYQQSEALWTETNPAELPEADIAVTTQGNPRVLIYSTDLGSTSYDKYFDYLACDSDCTQATNWTTTKLPLGEGLAYYGFAFALDGKDQPFLAFADELGVGKATCTGDCNQGSAWQASRAITIETLDGVYPPPVPAGCAGAVWLMDWGPGLALGGSSAPYLSFAARQTAAQGTHDDDAVCGFIAETAFLLLP